MSSRPKEKYVEGTRKIVPMGSERKSRMTVIPSEWFERLEKMQVPVPERIRWVLDNVGMTIPEGMSDAEALEHLIDLLYNYYPKDFVDEIIQKVKMRK